MENMSQSMALEDVEFDLDDDTFTFIPIPGTVESGNTVSLVVGKAGARTGLGMGLGLGMELALGLVFGLVLGIGLGVGLGLRMEV